MSVEEVFGVIDAQGFTLGSNIFVPREFSFVNDSCELCFEIRPNLNLDTKLANFRTISHQQHYIHGIPLKQVMDDDSKKVIDEYQLVDLVKLLFKNFRKNDNSCLGVKNQQLFNYLLFEEVPLYNYDMDDSRAEKCPNLLNLDRFPESYFCPLHCHLRIKDQKEFRCSVRKSKKIWKWQKNKLISDEIYSEINSWKDTPRSSTSNDD